MTRLLGALLGFLLISVGAVAQPCTPPNAPLGSIGCQPAITSPQSTDMIESWRPTASPNNAQTMTLAVLQAYIASNFSGGTISNSTIALQNWSTAGRPVSPSIGQVGLNTDAQSIDLFTSIGWVNGTATFLGGSIPNATIFGTSASVVPTAAGFGNPLTVNMANLTGNCTDPQCVTAHPVFASFVFGSSGTPDNMSGITSTASYVGIQYFVGGNALDGTRSGLRIEGNTVAASVNAPNSTVGISQAMTISANLGGTGTTRATGSLGKQFAYNPISIGTAAATNIRDSTTVECDNSWVTGSSVGIKGCFRAVSFNNDTVQGAEYDYAYDVTAVAGAAGFVTAYGVSDISGKFGLTGCVLCVLSTGTHTIQTGIDLASSPTGDTIAISGKVLHAKNIDIDGPTGGVVSNGRGTFNDGVSAISDTLIVSFNSPLVPTVGGTTPIMLVSNNFSAANAEAVFWNGFFTAAVSFDFRQITAAGTSTSVAKFTTSTATFPGLTASNLTPPAGGNVLLGNNTVTTTATSGYPRTTTVAGAPTGSVTAGSIVVDTTNQKICASMGAGTWHCI